MAAIVTGSPLGIGIRTFAYTNDCPYLPQDAALCANCHVMNEPYDGWLKSSHRSVATCIDCHDPSSMRLWVTRPGFIEDIQAWKASQGVQKHDVNKLASRQEIWSSVCGHCHVEPYFKSLENRLVYRWSKWLTSENICDYDEETGHKDWTKVDTGTPALKAQHLEFGLCNQGVQVSSGVSSADWTDAGLTAAQGFQRKAEFYLDFVEAENSTGFHAPQDAARIPGESINFSRQGQNSLRGSRETASPAVSTVKRPATPRQTAQGNH